MRGWKTSGSVPALDGGEVDEADVGADACEEVGDVATDDLAGAALGRRRR